MYKKPRKATETLKDLASRENAHKQRVKLEEDRYGKGRNASGNGTMEFPEIDEARVERKMQGNGATI